MEPSGSQSTASDAFQGCPVGAGGTPAARAKSCFFALIMISDNAAAMTTAIMGSYRQLAVSGGANAFKLQPDDMRHDRDTGRGEASNNATGRPARSSAAAAARREREPQGWLGMAVEARYIADRHWFRRKRRPGSFWVDAAQKDDGPTSFWFCCPCGCGQISVLLVGRGIRQAEPPHWWWNGSLDSPDLYPSLAYDGHWYGWLWHGEWHSA